MSLSNIEIIDSYTMYANTEMQRTVILAWYAGLKACYWSTIAIILWYYCGTVVSVKAGSDRLAKGVAVQEMPRSKENYGEITLEPRSGRVPQITWGH